MLNPVLVCLFAELDAYNLLLEQRFTDFSNYSVVFNMFAVKIYELNLLINFFLLP